MSSQDDEVDEINYAWLPGAEKLRGKYIGEFLPKTRENVSSVRTRLLRPPKAIRITPGTAVFSTTSPSLSRPLGPYFFFSLSPLPKVRSLNIHVARVTRDRGFDARMECK